MTPAEWIALATLALLLCGNLVGGVVAIVKLIQCLNDRFADLKTAQAAALASHEREDQRRHEENLQRFTAIETAMNGRSARRPRLHAP